MTKYALGTPEDVIVAGDKSVYGPTQTPGKPMKPAAPGSLAARLSEERRPVRDIGLGNTPRGVALLPKGAPMASVGNPKTGQLPLTGTPTPTDPKFLETMKGIGINVSDVPPVANPYKKGGKVKSTSSYKSGGSVSSASKRGDGCCVKGKTKGRFV